MRCCQGDVVTGRLSGLGSRHATMGCRVSSLKDTGFSRLTVGSGGTIVFPNLRCSPGSVSKESEDAMELSRRNFLRGALVGGAGVSLLGFDLTPAVAQLKELKIARATETRSTCPYCSVSCGVLIYTIGDKAKNVTPQVIHVEGDPDHPINRGTLCPKGASLEQDILNPRRLLKPQVRRPGSDHWEDIAWQQAIDEIAHRVKKIRDDTFIEKDAQGRTVNRCESLAWIGGCTDTNEFNYLVVKTMRSLGLTYIENQARV